MDITKQYDKACEAVDRGNDEYAIKLFQEILSICPEHLDSRRKLRDAVRRQFRKQGVKSAGVSAYLKGIVPFVKMHVYTVTKKYDQAILESEKFLALDPDNVLALSNLGKATQGIPQCMPTAVWVYESILELHPKDTKAMEILGRLYDGMDEVEKASENYERLLRAKPDAREVQSKLRDLAARKTIKKGWDAVGEKGSFKTVVKNVDQMEDRSGEEEIIRSKDDLERNIERVMGDIEKEPDSKKYVIQLGDLYRRGKRYEEAKATYERAKKLDANDSSIDERLGDLTIQVFESQMEVLDDTIRSGNADASSKEKLKALQAQRDKFATEEYAARVSVRPTDLPLRYKLGQLLYNAGNIDGALAEFQHAVNLPQFRKSAITYCGICLFKKGMYDIAVQRFEEAVKGSMVIDREDKNILYNLGLAAEKLGDLKKAEEAYKKIFNADINYRDVKEKMETLYKKHAAH